MVLKKLVQLISLPIEAIVCETVREKSGLAMSSRNLRLSEEEKQKATAIFQSLSHIKEHLHHKPIDQLQQEAAATLLDNGFSTIDYVAIADADTLQLLDTNSTWDGKTPVVALAAAFIGGIRLIDNLILR
jgi:pantoate--beta-alanine ligase